MVTRAGNFVQSPLVPWDECHKIFTRPFMILLVLHQIATLDIFKPKILPNTCSQFLLFISYCKEGNRKC